MGQIVIEQFFIFTDINLELLILLEVKQHSVDFPHSVLSPFCSFLNCWTSLPICQLFWLVHYIIFTWWILTSYTVIISEMHEKGKAGDSAMTYGSVAKALAPLSSLSCFSLFFSLSLGPQFPISPRTLSSACSFWTQLPAWRLTRLSNTPGW